MQRLTPTLCTSSLLAADYTYLSLRWSNLVRSVVTLHSSSAEYSQLVKRLRSLSLQPADPHFTGVGEPISGLTSLLCTVCNKQLT